ncbi:biotin--[acetyl-CoA-carboxylase] ligase [Corynebacterium sp.]|uniref:biotin--[acetyl-CoA-carboxylase] ligase n=1 Tax=Corynebacterium sp. TaxID=1720 RepID=UPI0037363308
MTIDIQHLRAATGLPIEYVATTGSTNADLLAHGTPGTVLIAGTQTAGRGRLGREWSSPEGASIALSVLIDEPPVDRLGLLPLAMGLAACDAITGTQLKWPNDVLVGEKKLAGILAQADFNEAPRIVVGIGINVNLTAEELPVPHATSLVLEGMEADPTAVVERLLVAFDRRQAQWKAGEAQLLDDYRAACVTIGQDVRLEAPGGEISGRADGVSERGEIIVDGTTYSAGDVTHLRAVQ